MSAGLRVGRSLALTVFVATALFLGALAVTALIDGVGGLRGAALVVSTLAGAVACGAMLAEGIDVWLLDYRMTAFSRRMTRSLVFVTVLAALALSIVGRNSLIFLFMAPSLVLYVLLVRRPVPPAASRPAAAGRRSSGGRQRRGGRKRRS